MATGKSVPAAVIVVIHATRLLVGSKSRVGSIKICNVSGSRSRDVVSQRGANLREGRAGHDGKRATKRRSFDGQVEGFHILPRFVR